MPSRKAGFPVDVDNVEENADLRCNSNAVVKEYIARHIDMGINMDVNLTIKAMIGLACKRVTQKYANHSWKSFSTTWFCIRLL
jgi:hypothetical protein